MTWKINNIEIRNFKFFHEPFTLKVDGKNLLLYGENGCGKSSIYWSFYTHYQACLKQPEQARKYFDAANSENLRNRFANHDEESGLIVEFVEKDSDSTHRYNDSSNHCYINTPESLSFMIRTLKASDFMNYKFLTSIFDFRNSQDNDVFSIFEKEFFQYLPLRRPMFGSCFPQMPSNSAEEFWQEIKNNIRQIPRSNSGRYIVSTDEHRKVIAQMEEFNTILNDALSELNDTANDIIANKFGLEVELQIKYIPASFNDFVNNVGRERNQRLINPKIILKARMTNPHVVDATPIEHPRSFFNEAKLTQMALSLRLAILDLKPTAGSNYNSTVFIDDLLVSLDMACRRKVIDVLLEYAENRQFVVMTHDRNFFYLFKSAIERLGDNSWKYIEMYAPYENGVPKPFAIENEGYLVKARHFLDKLEIPAAVNYLRKACEHELKRILPKHLRVSDDESGRSLSLNSLIQNFNEFTKKHKDFPQIVNGFTDDRKLLMNPFSHDDMNCQAYRIEVENLIGQIKNLEGVNTKMIVDYEEVRNTAFKMEMTNNGHTRTVKFEFWDRFDVMSYSGNDYYGDPQVKILSSDANRIDVGKLYALNKVHTKLSNSVSLNSNTAPNILDCTLEVDSGQLLRTRQ